MYPADEMRAKLAEPHLTLYLGNVTQNVTIRTIVLSALARYADRDAYRVVNGGTWTFRQIGAAIAGIQRVFISSGIGRGERVALLSESQPAWPASYLAIASSGSVVVPILPEFSSQDVTEIIRHSGSRLLLISRRQLQKFGDGEITTVADVPVMIVEDLFNEAVQEAAEGAPDSAFESLPEIGGDDEAAIIYTSGTTGHSKGVVLSHGNITSNVEGADTFAYVQPGERLLSILPLAHTYECTLGMLLPFSRGACVSYLDRPASPTVLSQALEAVKPHIMLAVPLLIEKIVRGRVVPQLDKPLVKVLRSIPGLGRLIYRAAGRKLVAAFGGALRFFGIGGAPLAADVETILYRSGFPYAIGYGLTETSPLIAGTRAGRNYPRSTGTPTPGVSVRIRDGEIQARGPNIMKGYYRDPERTAEVMTDDGWFRTGDLGEIDGRGLLYVKGRSKTVILGSNGENIYPEAIESILNQFRGVVESLVVQNGSRLVARVRLDYELAERHAKSLATSAVEAVASAGSAAIDAAGQASAYLEEMRVKVNTRLSAFSRLSDIIEQIEPFEKTPTFKIKRYLYQ